MARGAPSGSSTRMSRWRPTPEQLMVLQELFMRRGVRTPTAHQIQRITQQLKQFGKVETKNVFYWFQNHKAREKQKLRKSTSLLLNYYGGVQGGKNGNFQQQQQQQQPNFLYYCPLLGPRPPLSIDHSCEFRPFIPAVQMISRGNNQGVIEISAGDSSEHRNASSTEDQNRCNGTTNDSVSADRHDNNPEVDDQRLSGGECVITWMNDVVVDSITSRRPPLKTLQLFPTSSSSSSSSSMSGN